MENQEKRVKVDKYEDFHNWIFSERTPKTLGSLFKFKTDEEPKIKISEEVIKGYLLQASEDATLGNLFDFKVANPKTNEDQKDSEVKATKEKNRIKRRSVNYSIDKKVEDFIVWYYKNFVEGQYTDIGEYSQPREMLNIIEKMAVWYELRYPEYEVCKRFPGSSHDNLSTEDIYIRKNKAINEIENVLDNDKEIFKMAIEELRWEDILSPKAFISALPSEEKWFLSKPEYNPIIYVKRTNHLHLTDKGIVEKSEIVKSASFGKIEYYNFEGQHITEVLEYLKSINYPIEKNKIEEDIQEYNLQCELRERFLDIVMYRIIERGGARIGPRRAFMFALDFNRNIDIPMTYGVETSDPGLRSFIHEYIKAGGRTDLECLVNYGLRTSEIEPLDVETIQEILINWCANVSNKYTKEEKDLHQRLVNVLSYRLQ